MKIAGIPAGLALATMVLIPLPASAEAEISAERQQIIEQVDALETQISDMSLELWNYSEIALRETQSAEYLASALEREGFSVERGEGCFRRCQGAGNDRDGLSAKRRPPAPSQS